MLTIRNVCFLIFGITATCHLSGCGHYPWDDLGTIGDAGGYEEVVLDLPFAGGYQTLCTQGAHGSYSHDGNSTEFDIDLDTPNGENDLVYAPVGGVARVHTESSTKNFGYHVNIDRDDGTYVVVAHLSDVFVADGSEVAAGQIMGFEGCTGACSGDHVHIGLHEGDALKMAEYGTSVGVNYFVDDATTGAEGQTVTSEDVLCGTEDGHNYRSKLVVGTWHPNGSLVKTPDDNNVYRIENNTRRWIETEDVFWALGYDFRDVVLVSPDELDCYDVGSPITSSGERPESWTSADGTVTLSEGDLVKEESKSDVYVVTDGVAAPIDSWEVFLKLGFGARTIRVVEDGLVRDVLGSVGSCVSGYACIGEASLAVCATVGSEELDEGGTTNTGAETDHETEDGTTEDGTSDSNTEGSDTADSNEAEPYEDAWSMLEGEIDDGELGIAFAAPEGYAGEMSALIASVDGPEGESLFEEGTLAVNFDEANMLYQSTAFEVGSTFRFNVLYSDGMGDRFACELSGNAFDEIREVAVVYGSEVIPLAYETDQMDYSPYACTITFTIPGYTAEETVEETAEEDTAEETDVDSDTTATGDVEICYSAGVTLGAGELYLDGGFFTNWDTDPAASASSGDTEMCATVRAVSGEEIKVNAWFMARGSAVVAWAAYNNTCASIDWQGTVTVNAASVSVATRPWSDAAWASDPCMTGGDGYFNIP